MGLFGGVTHVINLALLKGVRQWKFNAFRFGIYGTFYLVCQLIFESVITYGLKSTFNCDIV